jgi:hypothetical protein
MSVTVTRIFISFCAEDQQFVEREIVVPLKRNRLPTWFAPQDIKYGVPWEKCIRNGLEECDWFLLVMSPNSVTSSWVQAEVHWAVEERWERIIPVMHETVDPTDFHLKLKQIQFVDFRANVKEARRELLAQLKRSSRSAVRL